MKAKRKKLHTSMPQTVCCEGQENENSIHEIKLVSDGEIKKGDSVWFVENGIRIGYCITFGIVQRVSPEGFKIFGVYNSINNAFKDVNNAIIYFKKKTIRDYRKTIESEKRVECDIKKTTDAKIRIINEFKTQISN